MPDPEVVKRMFPFVFLSSGIAFWLIKKAFFKFT